MEQHKLLVTESIISIINRDEAIHHYIICSPFYTVICTDKDAEDWRFH